MGIFCKNTNNMKSGIGYQLKAWGRYELPQRLMVGQEDYSFVRVFKHDFFAATLLFKRSDKDTQDKNDTRQIVLKLGRRADFLGIPLDWLGRALIEHEISILRYLQQITGVPRLLGRYGKRGLIYKYIPGVSLDQRPEIPDEFFDRLEELINQIHRRRVAYVDMNKQGNIILADNGHPCMIDFQISWHMPQQILGFRRIPRLILKILQREDKYHLLKHKRKLRRDLMDQEQIKNSRRTSGWIMFHRAGARPLTKLRRRILRYLFKRGRLVSDESMPHSSETDPTRWTK
jgi:predicted Ser/Thr protein kinase